MSSDFITFITMKQQGEGNHHQIKGLSVHYNFITQQQQQKIISEILKQEWNVSLKRRTQHYGYQYSYDRKSVATKTKELPQWCTQIKERIEQIINKSKPNDKEMVKFDQLIVNQYEPGQGINPHIDNTVLFNQYVVSLSLGSEVIMNFQKLQQKIQVVLKRRSVIILSQDARYQWKHSIPSRKSDYGKVRGTRYSLTFREMKNTKQ